MEDECHFVRVRYVGRYLVVDMVSTHGNRVHDELPPVVVTGSTERDVVRIVLCSKVMAQLMSGHQICLLMGDKTHQIYSI